MENLESQAFADETYKFPLPAHFFFVVATDPMEKLFDRVLQNRENWITAKLTTIFRIFLKWHYLIESRNTPSLLRMSKPGPEGSISSD